MYHTVCFSKNQNNHLWHFCQGSNHGFLTFALGSKCCIYPTPLPWTGCETKSNFNQNKDDFEYFFFLLKLVA